MTIDKKCMFINNAYFALNLELDRKNIQQLSRKLKILTLSALVALPLFNLGFWITKGYPFLTTVDLNIVSPYSSLQHLATLTLLQRGSAFIVTMIPFGLAMLFLWYGYRFFKEAETSHFFSQEGARCLKAAATTLLVSQCVYPVYAALISLVLTINNAPGERVIVLRLGLLQIILLLVSFAIRLIAQIVDEGRKLNEEVMGTI